MILTAQKHEDLTCIYIYIVYRYEFYMYVHTYILCLLTHLSSGMIADLKTPYPQCATAQSFRQARCTPLAGCGAHLAVSSNTPVLPYCVEVEGGMFNWELGANPLLC